MEAPEGWEMTLSEPRRNDPQNRLLHASIGDIAGQLAWAGEKRSLDIWKRLLVAAWMRATDRKVMLLPSLDGNGFDALYQRTSKLTKSECSELCEFVFAWGTEQGVRWTAPEMEMGNDMRTC